jgi:DNA-binding HxlR family transcriptional regulator
MACSIAGALEAVGDRWGFLLLRDLTLGLARYDEFQRSTGMPAQTLADRLRHLELSGLIVRRRYQERPPRDEYALTPKGRDFWRVLTALREWGDRWEAHAGDGPPLELVDETTGHRAQLALVDVRTGEAIPAERLETRPGPGADALMEFRLSRSRARRKEQGESI